MQQAEQGAGRAQPGAEGAPVRGQCLLKTPRGVCSGEHSNKKGGSVQAIGQPPEQEGNAGTLENASRDSSEDPGPRNPGSLPPPRPARGSRPPAPELSLHERQVPAAESWAGPARVPRPPDGEVP